MGLVQSPRRAKRWLLTVEILGWVAGIASLVYVGAQYADSRRGSREALDRFAELKATEKPEESPDLTLWSPQRIAAWQSTLTLPREVPLAVLRIPRIHLEVPVLEGTSGNSGIAGHRDGFFRGLKDLAAGDVLELQTREETRTYVVDRVVIVDPDDVSVLDDRSAPTLTLVTCYPFYYVGHAPQRWIVQGSLKAPEGRPS